MDNTIPSQTQNPDSAYSPSSAAKQSRSFAKPLMNLKVFSLMLILSIVICGIYTWGELKRWRDLSESYANKKGVMLAKTIEPLILEYLEKDDKSGLKKMADALTSGIIPNNDVISVQIIDPKFQKLAESSPQIITGEQTFLHLPPTIVVATPLMSALSDKPIGELRIVLSNRMFEIKSHEVMIFALWLTLLAIVLSMIFSYIITKRVHFPVTELANAAKRVAEREKEVRVEARGGTEVNVLVESFNHMAESIDTHLGELSNKNKELVAQVNELVALKHIGRALNAITDIDKIYEAVVDHTINILSGVKRCSLLVVDKKNNEFIFQVVKGLEAEVIPENNRVPIDKGIAAKVFNTGEPVLLNDLDEEDDSKKLEEAVVVRSSICAPLIDGEEVFAILSVSNRISGKAFTEKDLNIIGGIAIEAAVAVKNAKTYRQLNKKLLELGTLHEVGKTLGTVLEIGKLLDLILDLTSRVFGGVKTCSIMLYDEETNSLQVMLYNGDNEMVSLEPVKVGEGIAGKVFEKGEPLIINDIASPTSPSKDANVSRSSICVPLMVKKHSIGVLSVSDRLSGEQFENSDLDMIVTLASQISISIYNAQLYEDLESSYLSAVRALANSLDEKDAYTRGHSERVARYSVEIGKALGLSASEIKNLHIGSLLHDIGKIGVSEAIITKNDRLTSDEFDAIKTHPSRGAAIIEHAKFLKEKIPLIEHHHERYDGKGYPSGLKGDNIPLLARIVCVADSYDAMTSRRSYKEAMKREDARAELVRCSGTQFDPRVVAAFIEVMTDEQKLDFIEKLGK